MAELLVGYVLLSKQNGNKEWCRRTTYKIDEDARSRDAETKRTLEFAERGRSAWQEVEPATAFKVVPWHYGDDARWQNGSYVIS